MSSQPPPENGPPPGNYGPPPGYVGPTYGGPPRGYVGPASGGPPPRRNNKTVVAALVVGAVLFIVMSILGFVLYVNNHADRGGAEPVPAQTLSEPSSEPTVEPSDEPTNSAATAPRLTEATTLTKKFLDHLNKGDQPSAAALGCAGSAKILQGVILLIVDESTNLKAGAATVEEPGPGHYPMRMDVIAISGTAKSNPATGTVRVQDVAGQPLCVRLLQVKY